MAKDPAFLFYPGDWIGGTLGMSFEEKGAYMELLNLQFNRGHMTYHMMGHVVGQLLDKVVVKFSKDDKGLYYNKRLEHEINKRKSFVSSRNNNKLGKNQYSKKAGHMTGHMENENKDLNNNEVIINKLWFLKFYHSNYESYKSTYNGQSTTEIKFKEWKKFIDFIYQKKYEELFECKFISPHDFAKLVDFTEDKWDEVLKKILSTGIKPEHNLFFRIPEFMNYAKKSTGTNNQTLTGNKFSTGQDKLLAKGKQVYADITGKQST